MNSDYEFDVFLSHNEVDKPRVRRLAERLRTAGVRVWFDEWIIQPGDDIYLSVERGLEMSRILVLCLSPAALASNWVGLERSTVLFRDPANIDRRFIPLLLVDCQLPGTLRRYKYVDYREETQAAFDQLLGACESRNESAAFLAEPQRPVAPHPTPPESRDDALAFENLLDVFATRRAFFQGDERALAHVVRMLGLSDAGRAVAVARSLGEVAAELEKDLSRLRSTAHAPLKTELAWLVVACKDYAETYGRQASESPLPLPHIGWGQRIHDFTADDGQFGFASTDSFEVFRTLLEYISRSFRDLRTVRERALAVVKQVGQAVPSLAERSQSISNSLCQGRDYLTEACAALDTTAQLVDRV